ncbi:hypothetical protein [Streptomyces cupreus]|uniref:Uncharacterized protein n=1 Tax=Streptomyces cupreus TaxID=2759956 RepID=A0A7X1ME69_9ACTN|nr:hypothetical protein [Streptomyces cupreus]MBC2908274.1 hypothetical protein [Streptomyces cupreus]
MRALESSQSSERDEAAAAIAQLHLETADLQEKLRWEQERARQAEEACQRLEGEIENLQMKIRLERLEAERRGKEEQLAAAARVRDLEAQIAQKRGDLAFNRMQSFSSLSSYVGSDASDCGV